MATFWESTFTTATRVEALARCASVWGTSVVASASAGRSTSAANHRRV